MKLETLVNALVKGYIDVAGVRSISNEPHNRVFRRYRLTRRLLPVIRKRLVADRADLAALREAARWRYPPEMPTEGRWWVTLDDGTTERAIYTHHNDWGFTGWVADSGGNEGEDISHRVVAWQPLPEPAPKKEGTP